MKLLSDFGYFLLVSVLTRFLVMTWLPNLIVGFLQKHLVKTEKDLVYWLHYHNRAKRDGHKLKTPEKCTDGRCKEV